MAFGRNFFKWLGKFGFSKLSSSEFQSSEFQFSKRQSSEHQSSKFQSSGYESSDSGEGSRACCSENVHIAYRGISDDRLYMTYDRKWNEVKYFKPHGLKVYCATCRRRVY
jgi:hypothetical protein